MRRPIFNIVLAAFLAACTNAKDAKSAPTNATLEPKSTPTTQAVQGEVKVTPIHHASLLLEANGKEIYVDPWSEGDFTGKPKADLILITDIHEDHLDPKAIDLIKSDKTVIFAPKAVADKYPGVTTVIANGETKTWENITIEAVPMYNLQRGPEPGKFFHDKGRGNGYILTINKQRIYISGDTECTPEMKELKNIDMAFVCMNLPYTMPPAEAATCVKAFRPKVLIPYHYRDSNLDELKKAMTGEQGIELRLLTWY
jgi:L-ascorbate metabolism protein UlaG (beta-lactamase superfamily)